MRRRVTAGTLLFIACAQFILFLTIAETQFPGHSTNANFISDLGVWDQPSAIFFNFPVIMFGLFGLMSGLILREEKEWIYIPWLLVISGVGAIMLGVFPETVWGLHKLGAFLAFIFAAAAAVNAFWVFSGPSRYISVVLGAISFLAMMLSVTEVFLGVGPGGMERMVLYPILIWMMGFGAILLSSEERQVHKG